MKWYNSNKDSAPENGQAVLICIGGIYYVTIYDQEEQIYRLHREKKLFSTPGYSHLLDRIYRPRVTRTTSNKIRDHLRNDLKLFRFVLSGASVGSELPTWNSYSLLRTF